MGDKIMTVIYKDSIFNNSNPNQTPKLNQFKSSKSNFT